MPIETLKSSFRSLSSPVYRAYFVGMAFTRTGNWMQDVAQGWFVFEQTGSATAVGWLLAIEYIPLLLLAPYGGSIADRYSRRWLLITTQTAFAGLAFALAGATALGMPLFVMYVIALLRGLLATVNIPAGTALISEIVPPENMRSAASLNGLLFNLGRIVGALLATVVVATWNISACFVINGFSFLVLSVALLRLRSTDLGDSTHSTRSTDSSVREGLRYAWGVPELRAALVVMAGVGTFFYNAQVFFPLLARDHFGGGIDTYSHLMALLSAGFICTSLFAASGRAPSNRQVLTATAVYAGVVITEAIVAPFGWLGMVVIVLWGAASAMYASRINTLVQLASAAELKGRVMGLWTIVMWGTTPLGAPIVGWIGERYDVRISLAFSATVTLACLAYATLHLRYRLDERAAS